MMPLLKPDAGRRRFVYGPVPSRRLGYSLGVDILPYKTCSLDCVYCQLGSTGRTTCRRRAYFSVREVLAQVREALAANPKLDHVAFSGSGEPTLNANLGRLIRAVKKMTRVPVAVLTNGTLLTRRNVRRELAAADVVLPSLDAATAALFRRINRPHRSLGAARIVEGLARFRKEFRGQLWLEVMLVKGVNDTPAHVRALKKAIAAISPDRVQLNTVVRPPAETSARPLNARQLEKIRRALGERAEVVAAFDENRRPRGRGDIRQAIAAIVRRRPVTAEDISASLGRHRDEVLKALGRLLETGKIRPVSHGRKIFYEPA
jgi:wyosine [tRNA(Phe)-imidazoG37] synthetase (radical SAM superfamily)